MLSEFQTRKFSHYFRLWDADGDGLINYTDFSQLLRRIAALKSLTPEAAEYQELRRNTESLWTGILKFGDTSGEERISLAAWLEFCDHARDMFRQISDINAPTPTGRAIFSHMDKGNTGEITAENWSDYLQAWGIEEDPAEHFCLMDADGDGKLTFSEFTRLSYVWGFSDDAAEVGNYIFGRF